MELFILLSILRACDISLLLYKSEKNILGTFLVFLGLLREFFFGIFNLDMREFALGFYSKHVHELGRFSVVLFTSVQLLVFFVGFAPHRVFSKQGIAVFALVGLNMVLSEYFVCVIKHDF